MNNIKLLPSLLIFAEVAICQSFTTAAKQLNMSKSAISQNIRRLEVELGQQLLSRHTRGMSLTATGKKLLRRCELLRGQVELVFEEINLSKEVPSGVFALTTSHALEKNIVIPALSQLCIEYPQIEPDIKISDSPMDLIKNNLDVAIYGGELKDSNYRALPIGQAKEIFCATPSYLQKHKEIVGLDCLAEHKIIAAPWQSSSMKMYTSNNPVDTLNIRIKYAARTNTLPSVLEMILKDMGIALLPEFSISQALNRGELVRVLTNYQGKHWPFYLVHRFQGEKPIHINRFYQLVKYFFSTTGVSV